MFMNAPEIAELEVLRLRKEVSEQRNQLRERYRNSPELLEKLNERFHIKDENLNLAKRIGVVEQRLNTALEQLNTLLDEINRLKDERCRLKDKKHLTE